MKEKMLMLPDDVLACMERLWAEGFEAYAVGGCVRDLLMARAPHDFDLCTSARPEEIKTVFSDYKTILIGEKHGTVTVVTHERPLEITTFRVDGVYTDGRHPNAVTFTSSLTEDLRRRDFTVNAIAFSPRTGVQDPFSGKQDILKKTIRCVGEPAERFEEDALRILRALRFAARFSFSVDQKTALALHAEKERLSHISRERITAELTGILTAPDGGRLLREYWDVVLAAAPPLRQYARWEEGTCVVEYVPADPELAFAAFFSRFRIEERALSAEEQGAACKEFAHSVFSCLRLPSKTMRNVENLLYALRWKLKKENVVFLLHELGEEQTQKWFILRKAVACAQENDLDIKLLREMEQTAGELILNEACFSLKMLQVNGNDLKELGIEGKRTGRILHALLHEVMRGKLSNQKDVLKCAAIRMQTKESADE